MKKYTTQKYASLFGFISLLPTAVNSAEWIPGDVHSKNFFMEVGAEYGLSDNVYKSAVDEKSNTNMQTDLSLAYQQQKSTRDVFLSYYTEYKKESEDEIQNSNFWTGRAIVSQQLFSENVIFSLDHNRQRFIVDETQNNVRSNYDERDLLDLNLRWLIPYSARSTFIFDVMHSNTWFNDTSVQDSDSNGGSIGWQHALNDELQVQLSYQVSENNFNYAANDYTEQSLDGQLSGQYKLGKYIINIGKTQIKSQLDSYDGSHYGFTIDALLQGNLLTFNADRELTNSSHQYGDDSELDFSRNRVFWRSHISLMHQYALIDDTLLSKTWIYINRDKDILSPPLSTTQEQKRTGIETLLEWAINNQFSAGMSANYYEADLANGVSRGHTEAEIFAKYNLSDSIYIQFTTSYEQQESIPGINGYSEYIYTTRIAYQY